MKKLGYLISNSHSIYSLVEPIKSFYKVPDNAKQSFLCKDPVIYEILDGRNFSCDLSQIVMADFEQSKANIGLCYKIPKTAIEVVH